MAKKVANEKFFLTLHKESSARAAINFLIALYNILLKTSS